MLYPIELRVPVAGILPEWSGISSPHASDTERNGRVASRWTGFTIQLKHAAPSPARRCRCRADRYRDAGVGGIGPVDAQGRLEGILRGVGGRRRRGRAREL